MKRLQCHFTTFSCECCVHRLACCLSAAHTAFHTSLLRVVCCSSVFSPGRKQLNCKLPPVLNWISLEEEIKKFDDKTNWVYQTGHLFPSSLAFRARVFAWWPRSRGYKATGSAASAIPWFPEQAMNATENLRRVKFTWTEQRWQKETFSKVRKDRWITESKISSP